MDLSTLEDGVVYKRGILFAMLEYSGQIWLIGIKDLTI